MIDRRDVLKSSLVLAAAPALGLGASAACAEAAGLRLERFVYDARFAEARAAAAEMARRGVKLAATGGDLTELWREDLSGSWKAAPMTLAGVTTRGGLFVLETLAADHRMRVVHRSEHAAELTAWIITPRASAARRG